MSKILNLAGQPATSNNDKPAQPRPVMTIEEASKMAGALDELKRLSSLEVQTPQHAAQITGYTEYLANTFINHAEEFLGNWFTVQQQYRPLLEVAARFLGNIQAIQQWHGRAAAAKSQADQVNPAS